MACMGYHYLKTPKPPGTLTFTAAGRKKKGGKAKPMAVIKRVLISIIRFLEKENFHSQDVENNF